MGDAVKFYLVFFHRLVRDLGVYGASTVWYKILFAAPVNGTEITGQVDELFGDDVGSVDFDDLQYTKTLSITVLRTGKPHFNLYFTLQLTSVAGKRFHC